MFNMNTLFLCICLCLTCATSENVDETGGTGVKNVTSHNEKNANSSNDDNKLTTIAEGIKIQTHELVTASKGKLPVERNAQPLVVPRKGVKSSISARKGVEPITDELIKNNTKLKLSKIDESQINENTTDKILGIDLMKSMNIDDKKISATTEKTKLPKKFKPKPTVTIPGDGDSAKPIVGIPTKIPPLGMSSKINYVVPVIVTMLVLPLFIIFVIFLYRNGIECWEKRHYRRMDFLIDGMYNE